MQKIHILNSIKTKQYYIKIISSVPKSRTEYQITRIPKTDITFSTYEL